MIIRIYATESGAAWSTRTQIWRSNRVDTTVSEEYYPMIYDCSCSVEMGKIGTLKFTVGPEHPYYNNFRKAKTILTVLLDATNAGSEGENCLFRGPVSEISVDIYQQATITATESLGYLEHSLHVPTGKSKQKKTRLAWFQTAIQDHNSQMSGDPEKIFNIGESANVISSFDGNISAEKSISDTNYTDNMSFLKSNVFDECAGYLQVKYNSTFTKHYLNFVELRSYGGTAQQKLQFAINIEEISHDDLSDNLYTVLVPVGKDAKTIEGVGGGNTRTVKCQEMDGTWRNVTVTIDGKYMKIQEAIDLYGYIYEPVSFGEKSSKEDIVSEALKHIKTTYHPDNFTLKVKALDFHYLDDETPFIHLGDKVTVIRHSKTVNNQLIERKVTAICTAIDYDFTSPENTEYTVGTSFDTLTGSSGGGGGSSGGGGGYGGSFHDCIGYMLGDMAVIDHEITQINGGLLDINTSITNINSEMINLAGRVSITYNYMVSTYADVTSIVNWAYRNIEASTYLAEMYEQWIEFTGSQVYQTRDRWSSFVGLWYARYSPDGTFLGFVYRNGGGIFIEENNVQFGIYHEGNLTGGVIVSMLNDGTVQTQINGDIVNINANTVFSSTVSNMNGRMSTIEQTATGITSTVGDLQGRMSTVEQTATGITTTVANMQGDITQIQQTASEISASVESLDGRISGLRIKKNMVDFGFYEASGSGGKELTAGILVNTLSDGSTTTKIKADYIDFEGVVTASYINSLFLESTHSQIDYLHVLYGVQDALWVKNTLYLGSNLGTARNVLDDETNIMNSVISFNDSSHPIEYSNGNVSIPYKKLNGSWDILTFRSATSVSGSWSGNTFTVVASSSGKQSESITVYPKIDGTEQYSNFSAEVGTYDDGGNWIRRGDSIHGYLWQPSGANYVQVRTESDGGGVAIARLTVTGGTIGSVTFEKSWNNGVLEIRAKNSGNVVVGTDTYDPPLELAGTTQYDNFTAQIYEVVSGQHQSRKSVRGKMVLTSNGASSYVDVKPNLDGTGTSVARLSVGSLYTDGWTAAYEVSSAPTAVSTGSTLTVRTPSSTTGTATTTIYSLETSGATYGTTAILKTGNNSVAEISVGTLYTDGWTAAFNVSSAPTAVSTGSTLTVRTPSSTTGYATTTTYSLETSGATYGTKAILKTGNNSVAEITVGTLYTDGWTAAFNVSSAPTAVSTGSSLTIKTPSSNTGYAVTTTYSLSQSGSAASTKVLLKTGNNSVAEISVGSLYTTGRTDEAGTLSLTTPTNNSGTLGGNATRTTISLTATAKTINSASKTNPKDFTLVRSSFTDSLGKANQRCVELREGTTNIGRINVMDDYNAGIGSVKLYKSAWSGGSTTISKSDSGSDTITVNLTSSVSGPSGNNYTVSVMDGSTTVLTRTVSALDRYNAGWNAVSLSGWTLLEPTGGSATSNQALKITIPNKTDGTVRQEIKYLKMTAGSFTTDHKCNVYTRNTNSSYSTDGTYYLKYVVDASDVYQAGYSKGKSDAGGGSTVTISLTTPTQNSAYSSGGGGAGSPTGGASATQLTTLGNYLRNYQRGYVYFKVTAGSATKWYSIATPS